MRFTRILRFESLPRSKITKEYIELGMDFPSSRMNSCKIPIHKESVFVASNLTSATLGVIAGFFISKSISNDIK